MNTKTFAQQSRTILMEGVAKKLLFWGFDPKGEVLESPQEISGGYSFRGEVGDDPNLPTLWEALKKAVQQKGIEVVVEEAAYTWFNRLMALRIMAKNGYEPSLLENAEGLEHTPLLLQKARQGQYAFLYTTEQERLRKTLADYSKDQETFALLLVGYCHSNKMLNTVFGKLDDYTELLLPDNMLQDSGFLHLLNTTDAISDDEYKKVELIGWLYQFYISERKDEVFASFKKKKKAEAKDIPAATQIFTPNWIVKYMVENTAGKIWLDKHPDSSIKAKMKYLVENDRGGTSEPIINTIEDLTLIDPAAGSGHILVEGFDLLYQMYMEEYYTPEEAVESILTRNLFGLDIDDRAAQLATFAILLKAATKYRDVFTKGWLPNVYAMPEVQDFNLQDLKDFLGEEGQEYLEELDPALRLMKQAKNLGSVMKLSLNEEARHYIQKRYTKLGEDDFLDLNQKSVLQGLKKYIPILLILTNKYAAVVANPPYMGRLNMNASLKTYVESSYPISCSDLMTVFIEVSINLVQVEGRFGMINIPTWLSNGSYKELRIFLIKQQYIESLIHNGRGVFGSDFGSVSFVISNRHAEGKKGIYRRLFEEHVKVESPEIKEQKFLDKNLGLFHFDQLEFLKVPNFPLAYWLSVKMIELFEQEDVLLSYGSPRQGLATGDNNRFLRFWHELKIQNILLESNLSNKTSRYKWMVYNKGGRFRRWYGNTDYVINWDQNGDEIKSTKPKAVIRNENYYFKDGLTWSDVGSGKFSLRLTDYQAVFDSAGPTLFMKKEIDINIFLGLLNTKLTQEILNVITPSIHYNNGVIGRFPIKYPGDHNLDKIDFLVQTAIKISKQDWNRSESSWGFEKSPLLNSSSSLEQAYQIWKENVTQDFFQLHIIEEELNRLFIDIYDLHDEHTPEVALKDITILQEELNKKVLESLEEDFRAKGQEGIDLPIDKGEAISQFISYAIGLFMGRYRLDTPGLNIAHPNPTAEELEGYTYNNSEVIIDEDAIIPLMGKNCNFPDDALQQLKQLLDTIWGHESRTENINFIQECLNKDIEKFLVKDFYKYHCSMYKKKPIYWLFASPKGAFQVMVYMHRMNAFTVEKIRANYLLEHLKNLRSEENMLAACDSSLSTQEAKRLDQVRKDLIECEAYDMELKDIADQQIEFDLDDGVTVNYAKFESVVAKI